jgi:hypothetical protein
MSTGTPACYAGVVRGWTFAWIGLAGACARDNAAFDPSAAGTTRVGAEGDTQPIPSDDDDTSAASTSGIGGTHGPGTTQPPLDTTDGPVTDDGIEPTTTGASGDRVYLFASSHAPGAIGSRGSFGAAAAQALCLGSLADVAEVCRPDASTTAALLRYEASLETSLSDQGVPLGYIVVAPDGSFIAPAVFDLVRSGPNIPLADAPSVFGGAVPPWYWTGGYDPGDPNCTDWSSSQDPGGGIVGSPAYTDELAIAADVASCDVARPILCLCW